MKSSTFLAIVSVFALCVFLLGRCTSMLRLFVVCLNFVACYLFWLDKYRAQRGQKPRVPELLLHLTVLAGGAAGGAIGRAYFRHKTLKPFFSFVSICGILELVIFSSYLFA